MVKITVLAEDRKKGVCESEHGLSLYVASDEFEFLFDTGGSGLFLENAEKLSICLDNTDDVVLSHGHYDHVGGVLCFTQKKHIIAHPDIFNPYFSLKFQAFKSFPASLDELSQKHDLHFTKEPYEIFEGVYFLGEIPRIMPFEAQGKTAGPIDGEQENLDLREDDTGVAIKTAKGLLVLAGCSHSGICNILEHAKKMIGESRIWGVLGGFHLDKNLIYDKKRQLPLDQIVQKTIEYFKENKVQNIYAGHCVSNEVIDKFTKELHGSTTVHRLFSGIVFETPD